MKSLIILALAATAFAVPSKNKAITINGHGRVSPLEADHTQSLVDWYDCSGKADGNYVHPTDCTKFMSCVAREYAYERMCADCHIHEQNCPTGRLHYDNPRDSCLWAFEAGCVTDGGNQTLTTERPAPTQAPVTAVTEEQEETTQDPESCDPDDCETSGYCKDYEWCERIPSDHKGEGKKGYKKYGKCGNGEDDYLYWNPNGGSAIHNGTCDFWENLDQETKDLYNGDPDCINPHCEWKADHRKECSEHYFYFNPQKFAEEKELTCPSRSDGEQLLWNQDKKSCYPCNQVTNELTKQPCC